MEFVSQSHDFWQTNLYRIVPITTVFLQPILFITEWNRNKFLIMKPLLQC